MKNYVNRAYIALIVTGILLVSCQKDFETMEKATNPSVSKKLELNCSLKTKKTTTYVTTIFQNMGVLKINVENISNYKQYSFDTSKFFFLNNEKIDLANYSFILENGMLSLLNDNSIKMSVYNNRPYVFYNNYIGFPTKDLYSKKSFNLLLLVMNEIITDNNIKIESSTNTDKVQGCSSWNTYYVYGTGGSLSVAQANLESEIAYYTAPGGSLSECSQIGSSNSGCIWAEYGCIATQAFCCN